MNENLENKNEFYHLGALITIILPILLNRNHTVALKKLIAPFQDFENKLKNWSMSVR